MSANNNKNKTKSKNKKKKTKLGLSCSKAEDFPTWYSEVIRKSELIEYYNYVSGCYIIRPYGYKLWESIVKFFDAEIKKFGVENASFPLFVTQDQLGKEEDHVDDFSPEVAWVTRSGDTELAKPIALRPTSETIMYPYFAKWINSHRDLPLKINQWTNVVRWEFKNPTPFIRTREFLWQEGHTAHANAHDADVEVLTVLDLYARVYEELMAVPVIKGRKSEKEKFAGGAYTTTVEAFIPATGRAVQGATSHCLGENFSKMFNIEYSTEDGKEKKYVTQNSWGLTTRTLGVLVMVHGDDVGLVLPPRMAPIQVVIVWIVKASDSDELKQLLPARADAIAAALREAGVRTKVEHRVDKTASWKYNHWEQKGVPVRIEIGGKEIEKGSVIVFRRDKRTKEEIPEADTVPHVAKLMKTIQSDMLLKARRERDSRLSIVTEWDSFIPELDKGNLVLAPWCEETASEEWVKETTKQAYRAREKRDASAEAGADADADADKALSGAAKTLCIPFAQPEMPPGQLCFTSAPGSPAEGKLATVWCLWGRSY